MIAYATTALGAAPAASDPLEAAALIFNNRNALISDLDSTATLRRKSISEQDIAAGFAKADSATLDTVWSAAPDADALGFVMATIENNLRLGVAVPIIIKLLRARRLIDARLTEPLIAESFRRVQIKRMAPPISTSTPSSPSPGVRRGTSGAVLASLAIAGVAAAVGGYLLIRRRRRARGFAGLGSGATAALVPMIDQAWGESEADVKAVAEHLSVTLKDSYRRLGQANKRLNRMRQHIEDVPDEEGNDRDLEKLYEELEYEGTGMGSLEDADYFAQFQSGVAELRKVGRSLESKRRKLVRIAS